LARPRAAHLTRKNKGRIGKIAVGGRVVVAIVDGEQARGIVITERVDEQRGSAIFIRCL